jgi:hypothetical protein
MSTKTKQPTKRARLAALRSDLRHWQMMVRMDVTSLRATRARVKEIGAAMRKVQAER